MRARRACLISFVARKNKSNSPEEPEGNPLYSPSQGPNPSLEPILDENLDTLSALQLVDLLTQFYPDQLAAPYRARLPAPPHRGTRSPQRAGAPGRREARRRGDQAYVARQSRRHAAQPAQARHRAYYKWRHRVLLLDRSAPVAIQTPRRHARPAQRSLCRHRRPRLRDRWPGRENPGPSARWPSPRWPGRWPRQYPRAPLRQSWQGEAQARPRDSPRFLAARRARRSSPARNPRDHLLEQVPELPWEKVGGQDEARQAVRDAVELPLLHADLFKAYNHTSPKGILLYGPPGCGKTLLGKATAYNLTKQLREKTGSDHREYFMHVKGPEILNMWVGESERQVRELFAPRPREGQGRLPAVHLHRRVRIDPRHPPPAAPAASSTRSCPCSAPRWTASSRSSRWSSSSPPTART